MANSKLSPTTRCNLRLTNLVIRKPHLPSDIEINCVPTHLSYTLSPTKQKQTNYDLQKTCTNFMKGYIQKLKKQRKRKNKKLIQSNPRKSFQGDSYNVTNNSNVFIMEKIQMRATSHRNRFDSERVSSLIREIKNSNKSGKNLWGTSLLDFNQTQTKHSSPVKKLAPLPSQKLKKSTNKLNLYSLQPWNNEVDQTDIALQSFCN